MNKIIRDHSLEQDRHMAILEVWYPDESTWDVDAFNALKEEELRRIREEGESYDRETWFRQDPYFRYFRKYKKTCPVMMQVESFLLKGRPFPDGRYTNAVVFLTELKKRCLLGAHDADRIEGDMIIYNETEKVDFTGIRGETTHSYPGDITCRDARAVMASMIAGADERTCLRPDSRHILYFSFGTAGMECAQLEEYLRQVEAYIAVLAPGAETKLHLV